MLILQQRQEGERGQSLVEHMSIMYKVLSSITSSSHTKISMYIFHRSYMYISIETVLIKENQTLSFVLYFERAIK